MQRQRLASLFGALIILGGLSTAAQAQPPEDHPFALVNVISLFDIFNVADGVVQSGFDTDNPPPNWNDYLANPRVGTNPGAIAVHGDRLWIGGFCNGRPYASGYTEEGWYESLGIAEVDGILTISGFGAPYVRYLDSFIVGPTVASTDLISGVDYDPFLKRVYITYDDTTDISVFGYPSGAPAQVGSFVAAYDADPNSATYGQELWSLEDPISPPTGMFDPGDDRFHGGVRVDPFDGLSLVIPQVPGATPAPGEFIRVDTLNPVIDPNNAAQFFKAKDVDIQLNVCPSTWYRAIALDPITGDMYLRNSNAIARVYRDPASIGGAFAPIPRFIQEPAAGGNGIVDTTPVNDDAYVGGLSLGAAVAPGENIIEPGGNGIIDTIPAAGDELSPDEIVADRPVGNALNGVGDDCDDDPNGFPNGPFGQGQGLAMVSSDNIPELDVDLVIGNNRVTFGAGQLKDVRVYTVDGELVGQLELPCSPPADDGDPNTVEGLGIYSFDYDAESGTLVVAEMEQRKAYVFKANIDGSFLAYRRYDWDRDGRTDLTDVAALQEVFTGSENANGLELAEQRMNTDSDCDIDYADFEVFAAYLDAFGGP